MCCSDGLLVEQTEQQFRQFYQLLQTVFHLEFHRSLEALKDGYACLNPDTDTRKSPVQNASDVADDVFMQQLESLLNQANYEKLQQSDLEQALKEASLFKIRLQVDFKDFSQVLLYCRGEELREEKISKFLGLQTQSVQFINYDRVMVYIKFDHDYENDSAMAKYYKAGSTMLKLFQNVPKADLEMLFPNTHVRMRTIDKIMIGVPALVSGAMVISTKLGATLILMSSLIGFWLGISTQAVELDKAALVTLTVGMAALGSYLWKQFNNFKNRKLRFMQTLTQNLYFKNLDNNAGVFHRLIDEAEEEETKEAVLAYYFLLISDKPLTSIELDLTIESWFKHKWQCELNFEIADAMEKLLRLNLVVKQGEFLSAVPLEDALNRLKCSGMKQFDLEVPKSQ